MTAVLRVIGGTAGAPRGLEGCFTVKVEGSKSASSVKGASRTRKTGQAGGGGDFAAALDSTSGADETPAADGVDPTGAILGVGGILAAQSVDGDAPDFKERKRRASRGAEILDRLEEVRRGLLAGAIPKDKLAELARMVREKRERGADPIVSRLLDEIELRAEVELAKLGRRSV